MSPSLSSYTANELKLDFLRPLRESLRSLRLIFFLTAKGTEGFAKFAKGIFKPFTVHSVQ